MKKSMKILISILCILILLSAFLVAGFNNKLTVKYYTVETGSFTDEVKIALLTDFHSYIAGESIDELLQKTDEQAPDIVLLGGDIFNDNTLQDNTVKLLSSLSAKYPCYYVTGNHEYYDDAETFSENMKIVEDCGVTRLSRSNKVITVNGQTFNLCGVDDPSNMILGIDNDSEFEFCHQISYLEKETDNGLYTVLLSHRPEYFEKYYEGKFDLVLCGHTHGGQVRIPFIINGLFAPDQGWFPEYCGGEYEDGGTKMIISRGLTAQTKIVPRFYDRPELVMITLK